MYFGPNLSRVIVLLQMILFLSSIELAASSLVVSLKTWEMCDLGYTKVAPKVCVMQRNIGDYLTFRPQIVVDGGERVKFQKWFRLVRIFPGDKMFETLLTAETAGTYLLKNQTLEIPSLKEMDMDKNRLKYSAMGTHGTADDILFVIEQVPVGIRKYVNDPMLIDLSHYMTIPVAASHFNWTYRKDSDHRESPLPRDSVQQRSVLKINAIRPHHRGLYVCSFYGGHDGTMAFFLGEKIFQVTIFGTPQNHRKVSSLITLRHEQRKRHNSTRTQPALHGATKTRKDTKFDHHKSKVIFHGDHQRNESLNDHRKSHHYNKQPYEKATKFRSFRRKHVLPRFEAKDADDDDDEDGDDDEDEDDDDEETTSSSATTTATKKFAPSVTAKTLEIMTKSLPENLEILTPMAVVKTVSATPPPIAKAKHHLPVPLEAPAAVAKDFALMPRTASALKTGGKNTAQESGFKAWLKEFHANIKEETKQIHIRNDSVMDFAGKFELSEVIFVKSGREVVLPCNGGGGMPRSGVDKSKVVWMRVNPQPATLTPFTDRYEVLDTGALKIRTSTGEDSGEYGCVVDGKQDGTNAPLSVAHSPLPRVFVTVQFTSSTCKAYVLDRVTQDFVAQFGPHVCPDERCAMTVPVMQCHADSPNNDPSGKPPEKAAEGAPALTLSFNFKLGANAKKESLEDMYKHVKEIYDRAAVYIVKHGQIYKPDVFDGKFVPLMPTMQMKTYGYCTSGFGMQDGHVDKDLKAAYQCREKHKICEYSISV